MKELDLVQNYQMISAVAVTTRKVFDRALNELIGVERAAERAGCAIDEAKKPSREDMVRAFWAYLSDRAGYTTDLKALETLTVQEREQFDVAISDIVTRRGKR